MSSKYDYFPEVEYCKTRVRAQCLREIESQDRIKMDQISEFIEDAMKFGQCSVAILPTGLPSDLGAFENTLNSKGYHVTIKRRSGDAEPLEVIVGWD